MAKSTTEAATKKPPKKVTKGKPLAKEDVQYERPLMDDPEDEIIADERKTMDEYDPGPLPGDVTEDPGPWGKSGTPKIQILKGKLLKDSVVIEYTRQDNLEEQPAICTFEHTAAPRAQLKKAFAGLAVHAALLGEFIPLTAINNIKHPNPDTVKDFHVSGFTVVPAKKGDEGVILTAQKTLKSGKALGFNTPTIRFQDQSETAYSYLDELSDAVERYAARKCLNT